MLTKFFWLTLSSSLLWYFEPDIETADGTCLDGVSQCKKQTAY